MGEERAGVGQAEATEVTVGAVVHVRNTGLASGSEREPRDPFGEHTKTSQFYIGCSGFHSKGNASLFHWKGSHMKQSKTKISHFQEPRLRKLEPELKFLLQSYVLP